jgi:cytochrome b6-f complex iron-sulfur subunit
LVINEDDYSALLLQCTHKGCELQPQGNFLICPCHGSEFTNKGVVQNPPAEQNLKTFKTSTDNENIYIYL